VRGAFAVALVATTTVALAFVALPIVALFVHTSPGTLVDQLGNPAVTDALVVSLKTSAIAHALVLAFGTPAAYLLARSHFRGRALLLALTELPLVLPPAGPARVFARVALPLALGGLGASSALALARGLGEFGATIVFAGSLQGVTQTLPLAIYAEFDRDFDVAIAIGALFVVVGAALLLSIKLLPAWTRFASTSLFRSAPSLSS
jgi:ABC-type sulfate transport system permease component